MLVRLLFTTDDSPISQYIKMRQGPASLWTHVGVLLDSRHILEATPMGGVRSFPINRRVKEAELYAFRQYNCNEIQDYQSLIGLPYDFGWPFNRLPNAGSFNCATLLGYVLNLKGPRHPRLSVQELWDLGSPLTIEHNAASLGVFFDFLQK